jgi:hypothetical protein
MMDACENSGRRADFSPSNIYEWIALAAVKSIKVLNSTDVALIRTFLSGCTTADVPRFDGLDGVYKCLPQNPFADGPNHQAEQPSLEVLALAYGDQVDVGQTVGTMREGVGVAGRASPRVGVGRGEDNVVGIGPVVMQALPDAARAFRHIGLRGAAGMHLEVFVGAVAKELRATKAEVGEPGDVLLGR